MEITDCSIKRVIYPASPGKSQASEHLPLECGINPNCTTSRLRAMTVKMFEQATRAPQSLGARLPGIDQTVETSQMQDLTEGLSIELKSGDVAEMWDGVVMAMSKRLRAKFSPQLRILHEDPLLALPEGVTPLSPILEMRPHQTWFDGQRVMLVVPACAGAEAAWRSSPDGIWEQIEDVEFFAGCAVIYLSHFCQLFLGTCRNEHGLNRSVPSSKLIMLHAHCFSCGMQTHLQCCQNPNILWDCHEGDLPGSTYRGFVSGFYHGPQWAEHMPWASNQFLPASDEDDPCTLSFLSRAGKTFCWPPAWDMQTCMQVIVGNQSPICRPQCACTHLVPTQVSAMSLQIQRSITAPGSCTHCQFVQHFLTSPGRGWTLRPRVVVAFVAANCMDLLDLRIGWVLVEPEYTWTQAVRSAACSAQGDLCPS